jgi:hypothetical protein
MRRPSVADELRARERAELARLAPGERIRLALELGAESLELLPTAKGLSADEALAAHERQRRAGRRRSGCVEALLR